MDNSSSSRKIIFIIMVFYFCFSLFNYSFIHEDAFIYFRCAENIINGHGYSFNPGNRIEACSSFTWLYLLIFFAKLGCNLLTSSKILGIVFGCLSLLLVFLITRTFTHQMPWVILPSFLTSCSLPFLLWNQMGLETSFYTFIFLSLILICLKKNIFILWPLISILLVLTRPEGSFVLFGLLPVFYFYRERHKEIIYPALLFFIMFLAIIFIRLFYFHDLLPSPFYTKIYPGKFSEGLRYIHSYFNDHYMYFFIAPLLYVVWKRWNWEQHRSILFGFIAVYLLWVVLGGAENNPFSRHLVPVIPGIYIYGITGIKNSCDDFRIFKKAVYVAIVLFGFITMLFPKSHTVFNYRIPNPVLNNIEAFTKGPKEYINFIANRFQDPAKYNPVNFEGNKQILLGEFIRRNYFEGSTLVYDQMGQTPYQAGIKYHFIDSWGLTDKVIGRYNFHERIKGNRLLKLYERIFFYLINNLFPDEKSIYTKEGILSYIFEQNPDVILLFSMICYSKEHLPYWIMMDTRVKNNYCLKYFIEGALVFEKNGLEKNPLNIPEGLHVVFAQDVPTVLEKDHPLFQDILESVR